MTDTAASDDLFKDVNGESAYPTASGGTASLNSAMFFACPACGVCVLDIHYDATNRVRHQIWHETWHATMRHGEQT